MMSKTQVITKIDQTSVHRITSGQVVIDLQTAIKELVENSIDAGATNVEVRFKHYGLKSIEVVDNGSGIAEDDYENIALKHHTSKLETFSDLSSVRTFGFRGEALSSLCALSEQVTVSTATSITTPMGASLEMDTSGRVKKTSTVARQQGTTITITNIFMPLPVRRKEFERNLKREFGKALSLLNAYALGPCAAGPGVRLTVSNQPDKGQKSVQIRTLGTPSPRASVTALWGPKALDNIVDMDMTFEVERERIAVKRSQDHDAEPVVVHLKGLISKFTVGAGRTGTDRQFFFINGRPCNLGKIQKAFNEVYRSFNAIQAPFILADFILPTDSYDVNVSPDKRTILLHSEGNLISALKAALETHYADSRATYDLGGGTQGKPKTQTLLPHTPSAHIPTSIPRHIGSSSTTGDIEAEEHGTQNIADGPNSSSPQRKSNASSVPNISSQESLPGSSSPPQSPALLPRALSPPLQSFATLRDGIEEDNLVGTSMADKGPSMDVDDDAPQFEKESDGVVVDTSRTAWGQSLGLAPETTLAKANLKSAADPLGDDEEMEDEDEDSQPRKKRNLGPAAARGRRIPAEADSIDDTEDEGMVIQQLDFQRSRASGKPVQSRKAIKGPMAPRKVSKNPITSLRSQLVGFARTGSQISATDKDDEDEDEEEEEDDELHSDIPDMNPNPPITLADPDITMENAQDPIQSDSYSGIENSNPIDLTLEDDDSDLQDPSSVLSQVRASSSTIPSLTSHKDMVPRPEIIRSETNGGDISLRFDADKVKRVWSEKPQQIHNQPEKEAIIGKVPVDAGVSNTESDDMATAALARVIEKSDFTKMEVVGQFNLGFIVVRRRKALLPTSQSNSPESDVKVDVMDDLFIVDQHAADEKYNFETLQSTTRIQSQRLYKSQPLELTAADELLAVENIEVLRQNGFEIDVDELGAVGQGSRLKLAAQPVSKSTVFDMKDLEEVIHLLRDRPTGQMVRCSKARAMFAMRACRKSVMVGMPLTQHQMTSVIRHMGTMDQPWNCPHGRPTMRHLLDIRTSGSGPQQSRGLAQVDWSSFE